jgi:DinB family protein
MSTDLQTVANQFKFNNGIYERTVQGIPPEQWLIQPSEHSNHLLWVVGHAAVTRAAAVRLLGGEWSAPWQDLFRRGQKRADGAQYPSVAEVQQAWSEIAARLIAALPNASPQSMGRPVDRGKPSIDGTVGGTVGFLCLHESYHLGQMGFIRKWLGHGQALG